MVIRTCDHCEYSTSCKSSYDDHMKSKRHQERVENGSEELRIYFECKNCKKEYNSKYGLNRHNKTCKKVEESPPISIFDDTVIRQRVEEIRTELQTPISNKLISMILDKTKLIEELHTKIGDVVIPYQMNTSTSKFEYNGFSIEYKTEERMIHGIQLCEACNVNILDWYSSENIQSDDPNFSGDGVAGEVCNEEVESPLPWLNMNLAFELACWISPNLLLELAKWSQSVSDTTTKEKDLRIKLLEDMYVNKQTRKDFLEKPVVYMLTTEDNKNKRTYIIGKSINLKNRLSSYNKTAEHEVVYYRECKDEETMSLSENMILKKLRMYREKANRDRFILPDEKEITDFVDVIDTCVQFFE